MAGGRIPPSHISPPLIAEALRSEPIDFETLRQLLVKSTESPTGGHAATRAHVATFLSSDVAEPLIRTLVGNLTAPPDAAAIEAFVNEASSAAFFTQGKTGVHRQNAESALFASVLLTSAFPKVFVDYRQDRWTWAVSALELPEFPPPTQLAHGANLVHAGRLAQEITATEIFQHYFHREPELWTVAGLVYLLCKEPHFKELMEMPASAPPSPPISPALRKTFERFRHDPEARFIVELRRHHAGELRELLAAPERIDLDTFNKEVWVYGSSMKLDGEDVTKQLKLSGLADLDRFVRAFEAGKLELHGNQIWGTATRVYGASVPEDDKTKLGYVRKALSILNEENATPRDKARRIREIPGFGRNITTGLCMVRHPNDFALFNKKSAAGLQKLGSTIDKKDVEGFQDLARHLKRGLKADDFIQLDWFLYLVGEGKIIVPPDPRPKAEGGLNTILYGPPGTGKTYSTMERAVAICDGAAPTDRDELRARYKTLCETNRIVFVTFHQSYGYEEFVEGIRPVLADDEAGEEGTEADIRYECRDGIFKKLCALAKSTPAAPKRRYDFDRDNARVWKMSLGDTGKPEEAVIYDECVENGYALLGFGLGQNFDGCDSRDAVKEKLRAVKPDIQSHDFNITAVHTFKNEMQIGDFIIVSEGNHRFRAIGRIAGDYEHVKRDQYDQKRPVEWLVLYEDSLPADTILRKTFSKMTLYRLWPKVLKLDALRELLAGEEAGAAENYVLIIDEINRGNISKILGELITLLEPDKRLGGENELIVKLPYSGTEFGVPSNLYVLGTMNTADRSIALLDTALRRRFRFVELMPDKRVIAEHVGDGGKIGAVDVGRLLEILNDRIELLYDRDHQLGHSFFLGAATLSDLREVFLAHVLPLLQEYFYGDWEKIGAVLGCPCDPETGKTDNSFPILATRPLKADGLAAWEAFDEAERLRYEVNPTFLECDDDDLARFFLALTGAAAPDAAEVLERWARKGAGFVDGVQE